MSIYPHLVMFVPLFIHRHLYHSILLLYLQYLLLNYSFKKLLSCCAFVWARLGSLVVIHSFIHSFCLLPWHLSLSAHYFHLAFSRATKLARPLAKVVSYCSVVFWKKCTEQKATNIQKHEKTKQLSVRYFTNKTRFKIKIT